MATIVFVTCALDARVACCTCRLATVNMPVALCDAKTETGKKGEVKFITQCAYRGTLNVTLPEENK